MNVFLRQTNHHVAQSDPKQSTETGINQDESWQFQSGNGLEAECWGYEIAAPASKSHKRQQREP